jgi:hypothetical protein
MQFLSLWQKYKRQKLIDKQMRDLKWIIYLNIL